MKFALVINIEIETTKGDQEICPNCGILVTAKSLSIGAPTEDVSLEESETLQNQDLSPISNSRSLQAKGKGKSKSTKITNSSRTLRDKGKGKSTKKLSASKILASKGKGKSTKAMKKKS